MKVARIKKGNLKMGNEIIEGSRNGVSLNENNLEVGELIERVPPKPTPYVKQVGGDSIVAPHHEIYNTINEEVSIVAKIRIDSSAGSYNNFMIKNNAYSSTFLGVRGSDGFTLWYSSLGNWTTGRLPNYNNNPNGWYEIVYTYNSKEEVNNQRLYVNGSLQRQKTSTGLFGTSANTIQITTSSFEGGIMKAKLYNKALTQEEVKRLWNGENVDRGIIGDWRFGDGEGNLVEDHSGYSNHATINGGTWKELEVENKDAGKIQLKANDIYLGELVEGVDL